MIDAALPPGPPEVPQAVWDTVVSLVSLVVGWFVRKWWKR